MATEELDVHDLTVQALGAEVHFTWRRGPGVLDVTTMRVDVEDALDLVTRLSGAAQDAFAQGTSGGG